MPTTRPVALTPTQLARIAGALYLIQMATGVFGFVIRSSLTVRGDLSQTAQNISISEQLFRFSIVTDIATVVAVVVLSWMLYVLLWPVSKDLALLATLLRMVENSVLLASTVSLLVALALLRGVAYKGAFEATELHGLVRLLVSVQGLGHTVAFVLLGLGSSVFAYLLTTSRYVPRVIGAWGMFASLLLALGSIAIILSPGNARTIQMASFGPMGVYEVGLGAWLLVRGVDIPPSGWTD